MEKRGKLKDTSLSKVVVERERIINSVVMPRILNLEAHAMVDSVMTRTLTLEAPALVDIVCKIY